jgi:PAS domain S-box-containing protein
LLSDQSAHRHEHASLLLDAAPDAILTVNSSGRIVMANRQAERLFGHSVTALADMHIEDLVPEEFRSIHRAHHTRFKAEPTRRAMGDPGSRLMARHASGAMIPVEISLSPVDLDAEPHVIAVVRDVVDRLTIENERDVVRRAMDAVNDAVFMFEADTLEFSYVNIAASTHTGYSHLELISGMTPIHLKPEFTTASFRARLADLIDGTLSAITLETIHRRKDGTDIPVEISLSYPEAVDSSNRPVVAIVRDITNRKAAEHQLRDSEEAFRSAFEDAPVPMAMADLSDPTHRPLVRANRAFGDLLGVDPSTIAGIPVGDLTHPDDLATDISGASTLAAEGRNYTTEKRYRRADGSYVWGELHAARVRGTDGRPTSLAHIVDISRRVEAEIERDGRENLLTILSSIRKDVLQEVPLDQVLASITEATKEALAASHCLLATPVEEGLTCRSMDSDIVPNRKGLALPTGSIAEQVVNSGEQLIVENLSASERIRTESSEHVALLGPAIFQPLLASNSVEGVLVVARSANAEPFSDRDVATAVALANEAAVTLVLDRGRRDRRRMLIVEDRERIARDLHDLVIQRLFASGMLLQASLDSPERLRERASDAVTDLDETITVIRQTIFHLTQTDASVAGEIERLIDRHRSVGRNKVAIETDGELETLPNELREQLIPTLNELLTNVQRHADAETATVFIGWDEQELTVIVTDDGVGMAMASGDGSGFGISNLIKRAEGVGGSVQFESGPNGIGTRVRWSLPNG